MRILTWQIAAAAAGIGSAVAAFALVDGSSRILAAAVLGLAGLLALWPLPAGDPDRQAPRARIRGGRRVRELEVELARSEAERERLEGALRGLEEWVRRESSRAGVGKEEVASWS